MGASVSITAARSLTHVYAVDTASDNGTSAGGAARRVQRLASGDALHLARGEAVLEWQLVH